MKLPFPLFINTVLGIIGGWQTRRLRKASRHPRYSAERTLRHILTLSKDTVYGKEHHFEEILNAQNDRELFSLYQHFVPVNDYEALRPYVERHKNGEYNVLFSGKPDMYATTSGTTSEPKWIPMTHKYLKDVYGKMSHVWLWNFIKKRPFIFGGKILPIVGKECEGYAPDGTLYGSVSGVLVRDIPKFIKRHYVAPASVMSIDDYAARNYTLMLLGLQHRNLTLFATANPSTILELLHTVEEHYDEMVEDIEKGCISSKVEIAPQLREELNQYIKPRPKRAKELRKLKEKYGTVLPKHYWPLLQYLSTWKCGNTSIYMEKYMDAFDFKQTYYQELGYIATECRFGFSLDHTNESVLFPHFHYYEFVEEHELDKPNKHFLQIDELEKGHRYCAYVTTFSGLFRYNMNDLIEVGGRYEDTPTIHMISKVNGIVSMTGEKLCENQFMQAVKESEEESGILTNFYVGFADIKESTYHFYFEFKDQETSQETADEFAKIVDRHLQEINMEYGSKRASFRIHEPVAHRLIKNAYNRFKTRCLSEGFRDGQFKFNLLMQDPKRQVKFDALMLDHYIANMHAGLRQMKYDIKERRENRRKK
ncbi:MAG: GH3 auxin-responsive promoter family protein [Paludibacteraceae bacterium]|nr:GH3 auxin-responsive promoter family protein [Paludibacteraceae bacterium]